MGDSTGMSGELNDSGVLELTGKIMMAAIIILFVVVAVVFFLHLYTRWFWYNRREEEAAAATGRPRRRRPRFEFGPAQQELTTVNRLRHGLDSSVLKSIPVVISTPEQFKDGLECSVCLSEVADGEKARILPKCGHGFHVDCIDMWFQSHSTCPLCRNPISNPSPKPEAPTESTMADDDLHDQTEDNPSAIPTNVLFWGNETQISTQNPSSAEHSQNPNPNPNPNPSSSSSSSSSSSNNPDGSLIIDIQRQINEEEDSKSPATTRLKSFKRLLSRGRRVNPCSPNSMDIEQGSQS